MLACQVMAGEGRSFLLLIDHQGLECPTSWMQDLNKVLLGSERTVALIGPFDRIPWELFWVFEHVKVAASLDEARSRVLESPWWRPLQEWERFLRKARRLQCT
jgi:hypothetical protein